MIRTIGVNTIDGAIQELVQNKLSHQGKIFVSLSHEEGEMFKNSLEAFAKSDP
jgi:hypothetical protein